MNRLIDLTNKQFGKLKVIKKDSNHKNNGSRWLCLCDCGKEFSTDSFRLRNGKTKSCGCSRGKFISKANKRHGLSKTRLHKTWSHMIERCTCKTHKQYKDYGGRGIFVCKQWMDFESFHHWATENGYSDELTIDRIDVNGPYTPENCRWTDSFTQQNNTRRTIKITIDGLTKTISEWSKETGVPRSTITSRYYKGIKGREIINCDYKLHRGHGGA